MPIYEFFCQPCNTIYKFFSLKANTEKIPGCPKCDNPKLDRRLSTFATISSSNKETPDDELPPGFDEAKMEKALQALANEASHINEDDPRQAAQLMRKLSDATGLKYSAGMEEALHRLEKGEDPEKIEEDMGDLLEGDEPFLMESVRKGKLGKPRPKVDNTLYDL